MNKFINDNAQAVILNSSLRNINGNFSEHSEISIKQIEINSTGSKYPVFLSNQVTPKRTNDGISKKYSLPVVLGHPNKFIPEYSIDVQSSLSEQCIYEDKDEKKILNSNELKNYNIEQKHLNLVDDDTVEIITIDSSDELFAIEKQEDESDQNNGCVIIEDEKISRSSPTNQKNCVNDERGFPLSLLTITICPLCDMYSHGDMKEHFEYCHRDGIFFHCPLCDSQTRFTTKLSSNERLKHRGISDVHCQFCGKKFKNWLSFSLHISIDHDNKVDKKCNICGVEKKKYSRLLVHILTEHNGESLVLNCHHCNFKTLNSGVMKWHVDAKHYVNDEVMKNARNRCHICNLPTKTITSLRLHMKAIHCAKFKMLSGRK